MRSPNDPDEPHELVEGRSCGKANKVLPRLRCFLFEEEHDGGFHMAWMHYPGEIVTWRD